MKQSKSIVSIITAFFFSGNFICAQIRPSFIKHLSDNKLYHEHLSYLKELDSLKVNSDSLFYFKAKYYLQYFNDSLFILNYEKSKAIFLADTCAVVIAGEKYLKRPLKEQSKWFNSFPAKKFYSEKINLVWAAALNPVNISVFSFPQKLQLDFLKYKKNFNRKPFVAGMLSATVPGLGKLYAGRKRSFYITLLTHIGFAVQNYEAINKLGIKNPYTIFSLGFSGLFYLANIYGSYNAVAEVKKELRTQFLINASDYYTINCPCRLY